MRLLPPGTPRRVAALAGLLALSSAAAARRPASAPSDGAAEISRAMAARAGALLEALEPDRLEGLYAPFDDAERRTWAFGPVQRKGVDLRQLTPEDMELLEALLDTALSARGMQAWREIRGLEDVLFERESKPGKPANHRNSDLYWLRLYGLPTTEAAWSWRFEGHHFALHVTCRPGELPTVTPFFIGASPVIDARAREVTVHAFDRLQQGADQLLDTLEHAGEGLSPGQKPGDIRMGPGKWELPPRDGLNLGSLGEDQRAAATALLDSYLELLDEPLRQHTLTPDQEATTFAHWGEPSHRAERAWSLATDSFALEFATTSGASHVHALLRDAKRDFGGER